MTTTIAPSDQKRFWGNVDMLGNHWWWTGSLAARKYPILLMEDGEYHNAAYVALELSGRTLPEGYRVRYKCLRGLCINPDHLRMYSKSGGPWGKGALQAIP